MDNPTAKQVMLTVAKLSGLVPNYEIYKHTRAKRISHPRQLAILIIRDHLGYSYHQIANSVKLNHSTVIEAVKVARNRLENDADTLNLYLETMRELFGEHNVVG